MSFDVISATCKLLNQMTKLPASSLVPAKRPNEFITIERTGGGYSLGRDEVNLAVQCWAQSEARAYELACIARVVLSDARELVSEVCSSRVESIYSFPDPDSRAFRYQLDVYMITRP